MGDIAADVTVAGGTVEIGGTVAGDVRAIGGVVTVHGVIEEDLFVAGGTVRVEKDARIGACLCMPTMSFLTEWYKVRLRCVRTLFP